MNLGGLTLKEALRRTWVNFGEHEVMTRAAAITFYAVAALVPFLALVLMLAAYLLPLLTNGGKIDPASSLADVLPAEAAKIVAGELKNLQEKPSTGLLSFGTIALFWLSSSLFVSVMDAMNRIMGVAETRPYWKQRLIAILMTLCVAVVLILVLASTVLWPQILSFLKLDAATAFIITVIHGLTVFAMVLFSFSLTLYFAPDADQRWEWISPGSLLGSLVLVCVSYVFRFYVQRWGDYSATYGSLAGIVVLMSWMWLCSVELLAAAEFNKVVEHASPFGKNYGEKHENLKTTLKAVRGTTHPTKTSPSRVKAATWLPSFFQALAERRRNRPPSDHGK